MKIKIFFIEYIEVITVVEFKKCITSVSISCIIIGKFNYWKEFYPVILYKVDKNLEIDFQFAVLSFNLTISLRIKSDRKSLLNT